MDEVEGTQLGSVAEGVEWSRSDDDLYVYRGPQGRDFLFQVSVPGMQVRTGQHGLAT